jgi:hypothetical protein
VLRLCLQTSINTGFVDDVNVNTGGKLVSFLITVPADVEKLNTLGEPSLYNSNVTLPTPIGTVSVVYAGSPGNWVNCKVAV